MTCPLCLNKNIEEYHQDKIRNYRHCLTCDLVFVNPDQYLTSKEEKAIYDRHENNSNDLGYINFLNKLLVPLVSKLPKNSRGLDFGCGPGPAISVQLNKQGFQVEDYDIFYEKNLQLLEKKYDFITCTELIEHLYFPHKEITLLTKMLNNNGFLGVMTKRVINKEKFKTWHYKNDPTHVCFYSNKSFEYIADYWGFDLEIINSDTIILKKAS